VEFSSGVKVRGHGGINGEGGSNATPVTVSHEFMLTNDMN